MAYIPCNYGSSGGTQVNRGTGSIVKGTATTVTVGFKPSIVILQMDTGTSFMCMVYDESGSPNQCYSGHTNGTEKYCRKSATIPNTLDAGIRDITNTGFIYYTNSGAFPSGTSFSYVAIKL